ncbi:hypothetical protein [Flavobacterium sp. GSP14]|uniref:hypothetical protein n=1 Tax=Flavobacterium sp. GSP14 TaxID=3401734 RepID=UPI003AB0BC1F
MAEIFINGLYFNNITNQSITVNLFDKQASDNSFGKLIFSGESDRFGQVTGVIGNKFIGKNIIIGIIEPGFIPIQAEVKVTELGVLYHPNLIFDRSYIGTDISLENKAKWNSQVELAKAQKGMESYIRKYRFKNFAIKFAHYFIIVISIVVGILVIFPYNIIFAILFVIIGEILGPYAIGLKPFYLKKN